MFKYSLTWLTSVSIDVWIASISDSFVNYLVFYFFCSSVEIWMDFCCSFSCSAVYPLPSGCLCICSTFV